MHKSLDEEDFLQISNRVTALDWRQNLFLSQYLETNRPINTNFCIHTIIDRIYLVIVNHCFRKFVTELRSLIDVRNWFSKS